MATWQAFAAAAPSLADRVRKRFTSAESHILATLRRDGSPRVSGSEVDFRDGSLYVGSMLDAVKARDLRRDGRFAIHAAPGDPAAGGDAKLAGVATEVTDPALLARIQGGGEPSHLFHLDIREAALTWVEGNTLFVESWQEGKGLVRFARPDNGPAIRTELD
ncbi:pyridoxamine 5'-phosphate oxidase family protein [Amycolatopsis sp. NBC_00345]|uniref:pyridoxamine 5'-phosphate oxidase family protein n=1 Tax=Amycolatopsis sp. NBC_00345 TaxID=2975955 RepID=UPI002E260CB0